MTEIDANTLSEIQDDAINISKDAINIKGGLNITQTDSQKALLVALFYNQPLAIYLDSNITALRAFKWKRTVFDHICWNRNKHCMCRSNSVNSPFTF